MPLDLGEIVDAIVELETVIATLRRALADGTIDREERKDIGRRLATMGIHIGRDIIDGPHGNEIPGVVRR